MKNVIMAVLLCIAVTMTGCLDILEHPLHPTQLNRPAVQVYLISAVDSPVKQKEANVRRILPIVRAVQAFYADEMERYGYGRRTFGIHAEVKHITALHPTAFYNESANQWKITTEMKERLGDVSETPGLEIRLFFQDNPLLHTGVLWDVETVAHELGHVFGLRDNYASDAPDIPLMETSNVRLEITATAAAKLSQHPAFVE